MTQNDSTRNTNPVVFTIQIPWETVKSTYTQELQKAAATATIQGFRPGKAPVKLVEEKVGKKAIYNQCLEVLLPKAYQDEVTKRDLKPYIQPRVKPIAMDEDKPWSFEFTVVTKPEVKLDKVEAEVKKTLGEFKKSLKEGPKDEKEKQEQQIRKMNLAFDAVLKSTEVTLPQLLVDEEVNIRLTKLLDQVQALGMSIDQYMKAKNLTAEGLRAEYDKTAREMLTLNLSLDAVATRQKFEEKDRISKAVDWLVALG